MIARILTLVFWFSLGSAGFLPPSSASPFSSDRTVLLPAYQPQILNPELLACLPRKEEIQSLLSRVMTRTPVVVVPQSGPHPQIWPGKGVMELNPPKSHLDWSFRLDLFHELIHLIDLNRRNASIYLDSFRIELEKNEFKCRPGVWQIILDATVLKELRAWELTLDLYRCLRQRGIAETAKLEEVLKHATVELFDRLLASLELPPYLNQDLCSDDRVSTVSAVRSRLENHGLTEYQWVDPSWLDSTEFLSRPAAWQTPLRRTFAPELPRLKSVWGDFHAPR